MRAFYTVAVGLAAVLTAGTAKAGLLGATAIYSSFVTSLPDQASNPNFGLNVANSTVAGSPLAQEFHVAAPVTLTSLDLRLSDATAATDGGSILIYLVTNNAASTPLPSATGTVLTGAKLLATILDSMLPVNGRNGCVFGGAAATINACNTVVPIDEKITLPGDYWIALADGSDTANGGTNPNPSNAVWWRSGDNIGLNTFQMDNAHVNKTGMFTSQTFFPVGGDNYPNAFELQVNVAEAPSLALLAAGTTALGLIRRRLPRKRPA